MLHKTVTSVGCREVIIPMRDQVQSGHWIVLSAAVTPYYQREEEEAGGIQVPQHGPK